MGMQQIEAWMVGVGVIVFSVACGHKVAPAVAAAPPPSVVPATPPPPPARPPAAATARRPAPLTDDEMFQRKTLAELNAEHPLGDAFFDYDQDTLRDDARAALARDAQWLTRWRQTRIMVEGHCDERGTAEYNLALGDRRAEAVKSYLASLGVAADRVEVRSVGKDAPFCQGDTETCWSQNRRGHFLVTAK